MTKRTWLLLLLSAVLALCLAACSSSEPTTEATTTNTATSDTADETPAAEPADTVTEPATEPEPVEPAPAPAADEGTILPPEGAFSDAATAFDELTSYRYTTLFTFVGEEDGKVEAGSIELTGIIAGPDEKHLVWMNLEDEERFELIQLGNRAWILDDDEWQEAPVLVAEAMSQAVLIYAPSIAWSGIFGELEATATYLGKETVNGVSSDHYTSTYEEWGTYWPGELENATGDVWIAEAGYPVKYRFSATGNDEEGDSGTVTWRMDLTDVDADITIEPPIEPES